MELIENIKDTISKRLKGAFGGTFIIVWTILNWRLVYILFNFDKDCSLNDKLIIIETYIIDMYPWRLLYCPVILTILSVFSYSILNYITYSITSYFSLVVKPFILNFIDKNEVVERSRYETIERQYFELDKNYTNEKANFIRNLELAESLTNEKNQLSIDIKNKQNEIISLNEKSQESITELRNTLNKQLQELADKLKEKESEIYRLKIDTALDNVLVDPSAIFEGSWEKSFTDPITKFKGKEVFSVVNDSYLINGKNYMTILQVKLFAQNKFIEIKKLRLADNVELTNNLIKITDRHFIGTENDQTRVEYRRIL